MISEVIPTRFGQIEYRSSGQGKPVLFIHGGHSNCHEELCKKGFNTAKYQLIIPSRPGYGKTPLGSGRSPEEAAALINELLNHLSIDQVVVYGISAGGPTAIALAANFSDRVKLLVLVSAVTKKWLHPQDKTYRTAKMMFKPGIEGFIWSTVRLFSALFPKMIAKSFFSQFSTKPSNGIRSDDVKELIKMLSRYRSGRGFLNDLDQETDDNLLSIISCPTLIIHSANDVSVAPDHAEHANKLIKGSTLEMLNNEWGHLVWLGNDARETVALITSFIEAKWTVGSRLTIQAR